MKGFQESVSPMKKPMAIAIPDSQAKEDGTYNIGKQEEVVHTFEKKQTEEEVP
jgi:hypothetical protein